MSGKLIPREPLLPYGKTIYDEILRKSANEKENRTELQQLRDKLQTIVNRIEKLNINTDNVNKLVDDTTYCQLELLGDGEYYDYIHHNKSIDAILKSLKSNINLTYKRIFSNKGVQQILQTSDETVIVNDDEYLDPLVLYLLSALSGDCMGYYKVARMFYYGYGVEKDRQKAFKYYKKAAAGGVKEAQFVVGKILFEQNKKTEAKDWYKKSRKSNSLYDDAHIALTLLDNKKRGKVKGKADEGDAESEFLCAEMYYFGYGGEKDKGKAFCWYEKSAEQGCHYAQYRIGRMYYYGQFKEKDYKKAYDWYLLAAEQNHPKSQFMVANMLYRGLVVEEGESDAYRFCKAMIWYCQAAQNGDKDAIRAVELLSKPTMDIFNNIN
ncbi:MAG: sel1 repeat family protein [Bacteroidales bacterium]|jgi:TPR repeat protein|nr:sel1 repeat family protein [Bacteroidales bacterium]